MIHEVLLGAVDVDPPGDAAAAAVADRWAARDAARMAELTAALRCRYCSRGLTDASVARHPGLCASRKCRRRARLEGAA